RNPLACSFETASGTSATRRSPGSSSRGTPIRTAGSYVRWPTVTHFIAHYGLFFLFAIVCLESAGLWLPGETALIAAGVYASKGHLSITGVIVIAAVAAIIGDNIGYWIGREGGRRLLYRYALLRRFADRFLPAGERFFRRHGGKAVFLARFFGGVRVTGAWIDRKSTRLNSSHRTISYAVFCLKKKKK